MKLMILVTHIFFVGCAGMPNKNLQNLNSLDYLTDVNGSKALDFVAKENKITSSRIQSDPRYEKTYTTILSIMSSPDKLPLISLQNDKVLNFWQDEIHVRGILRSASVDTFNSGKPNWETILDLDLLAKTEEKNWVYQGIECLEPHYENCLIRLSDGGRDAAVIREFNLSSRKFVDDGFFIPESKSQATWLNSDTLLVADGLRDLTMAGYPSTIKVLKRGQLLTDGDILLKVDPRSMAAYVYHSNFKGKSYTLVWDQRSFFDADIYLVDFSENKLVKLPFPSSANFEMIFEDSLFFSLRENFENFPAGSVISLPVSQVASFKRDYALVFKPTETEYFERLIQSKNSIFLETLENVKRTLKKLNITSKGIQSTEVSVGQNRGNESVMACDKNSPHVYFLYSDFLTPQSLFYLRDSSNSLPKEVLKTPSRFKSEGLEIKQYKALSKDGTHVPYFVVMPKDVKLNGQNPTLMYAYGGFEIPLTQSYLGSLGKVWLEKGGVYVSANIRGGGEFGPNWHRSALQTNRHKAFEDFYAVAEDLIKRKITSPQKLGIRGGSNGGLLTSVAFTQKPELFNAVISEVPLANMLEYHKWLAGASWMQEYGNPEDPVMRKYLLSYSPLHNLKKEAKYPEVFYLTSTKDDRVHPGHARQMVARMKELGHPVLYNENTDGGHGRGTNMKELAEFLALEITYLYQKLMP